MRTDDAIAALASAPGLGARGILRVSGTETRSILDRLFQPDDVQRWRGARIASCHFGRLRFSASNATLPALVYLWPRRSSYTGEPLAELHLVGSPPLLEAALAALYAAGARPAEPGEFTLRAFLAGRVDLVQAEAVLGVVDAHNHRELEAALKQLAGGLSGQLAEIRAALLDLLADLEAGLDFVDEDIQFVSRDESVERIGVGRRALETLLEQASSRMQSTGRLRVVLAGLPNAGKSTLFNALAGREAALVSEAKGTTRDYLSAQLQWCGVPVALVDTAGWESTAVGVAQCAQELRGEQVSRADFVLWCTAADLGDSDRAANALLSAQLQRENRPLLVVATKADLEASRSIAADVRVSARTGFGLVDLVEAAASRLTEHAAAGRQFVGMTAARARDSLTGAIAALSDAERGAASGAGDEIVAISLREGLDHLGAILGTIYTDDVLDRIFSRFCIGK